MEKQAVTCLGAGSVLISSLCGCRWDNASNYFRGRKFCVYGTSHPYGWHLSKSILLNSSFGVGVRGAILALNGAVKYRYDGDQAKDSASWGYVQGFLRTIFLKLGGFTQRTPSFLASFQWHLKL